MTNRNQNSRGLGFNQCSLFLKIVILLNVNDCWSVSKCRGRNVLWHLTLTWSRKLNSTFKWPVSLVITFSWWGDIVRWWERSTATFNIARLQYWLAKCYQLAFPEVLRFWEFPSHLFISQDALESAIEWSLKNSIAFFFYAVPCKSTSRQGDSHIDHRRRLLKALTFFLRSLLMSHVWIVLMFRNSKTPHLQHGNFPFKTCCENEKVPSLDVKIVKSLILEQNTQKSHEVVMRLEI